MKPSGGREQSWQRCGECGTVVRGEASHCWKCGTIFAAGGAGNGRPNPVMSGFLGGEEVWQPPTVSAEREDGRERSPLPRGRGCGPLAPPGKPLRTGSGLLKPAPDGSPAGTFQKASRSRTCAAGLLVQVCLSSEALAPRPALPSFIGVRGCGCRPSNPPRDPLRTGSGLWVSMAALLR